MNNEEVKKDLRGAKKGHPKWGGKQKMEESLKANYNFSIKVNREDYKKFQEVCKARNTNCSKVLKSFMRSYIEEYGKEVLKNNEEV